MSIAKITSFSTWIQRVVLILLLVFLSPVPLFAYIGPGAGFAVVSSFFFFFITIMAVIVSLLTWPFRWVVIFFKQKKMQGKSKINRLVILGLDGFDPTLAQKFITQGSMPHFSKLSESGCFRSLETTTPSISPVAWSTFATGTNPGKHRIFDFYTRDPATYQPVLSSVHISSKKKKFTLGPFTLPINKVRVSFLRKSLSFWKILGHHGIFSSIQRVPITFPPEKFYGACLSAMCTPDLLGTQGTFTLFTSNQSTTAKHSMGGRTSFITLHNTTFTTTITGPTFPNNTTQKVSTISVKGTVDYNKKLITLKGRGFSFSIKEKEYSPWIRLSFAVTPLKKISGIARFLVTGLQPHLTIYMTPINIDPGKPSLPISHPAYYATLLSKLHGSFASLGLAEDTWALNEEVINEDAFLNQAYAIFEERKCHLMNGLKKHKRGVIVSVFDTPDRIQHMFFRHLSHNHPANNGKDTEKHSGAIDELYQKMDSLLADVQQVLQKDDLLMIISDHGFTSFKWGVNLNSWLWKEGYLVYKNNQHKQREWFQDVDWTKTTAYAYGLTGIFINTTGRENQGIVNPGKEVKNLGQELKKKLENLCDPHTEKKPIRRVFLSQEVLSGPYTHEAPDLLIGFDHGYRVSWNSAIGKTTDDIIEKNTRYWSGDHSVDPEIVPGVFFSNWHMVNTNPSITDIAPTILNLFGIKKQAFHDGTILELQPKLTTEPDTKD